MPPRSDVMTAPMPSAAPLPAVATVSVYLAVGSQVSVTAACVPPCGSTWTLTAAGCWVGLSHGTPFRSVMLTSDPAEPGGPAGPLAPSMPFVPFGPSVPFVPFVPLLPGKPFAPWIPCAPAGPVWLKFKGFSYLWHLAVFAVLPVSCTRRAPEGLLPSAL